MLKNISISVLLWLASLSVFGDNYQEAYGRFVQFAEGNDLTLLSYGVLGSMSFVGLTYMIGGMGWYTLMFLVNRVFFWLSQFFICLISVLAIAFWFDFGQNIWMDLGASVCAIPFVALGAGAISLRLFDFNFSVIEDIKSHIILPVLSGLIIWFSTFILS